MKHANVAVFVPHNGCTHACSFCDQRQITGQQTQPTAQDVRDAVLTARNSLKENTKNAEIAFFGGSFTAIDRRYMEELLKAAAPFVWSGEFSGIRISTRPDAVSEEILEILKHYGVSAVELGAQSMSDKVLQANLRGHTAEDVTRASDLIRTYGFSLGLQMMTGLYQSSAELDRQTAAMLAKLRPDTVRIYPTVVLKGTLLDRLFREGKYIPPTLTETVVLCAELLQFFEERQIRVIRLGLHDSDSLHRNMTAGVFHPALRELCEGEILFRNTLRELETKKLCSGTVVFRVHPSSVSKFVGQQKRNVLRLKEMGVCAKICQDGSLGKYEVRAMDALNAQT